MVRMQGAAEFYRSILDNLTGGLVSVSLDGSVAYINPMAGRILHLPEVAPLLDKKYGEVLSGFPALCDVVGEALRTRRTVHRAEITVMHGDKPLVIGYSTLQVKNADAEILGIAIIFQDLTFVAQRKAG